MKPRAGHDRRDGAGGVAALHRALGGREEDAPASALELAREQSRSLGECGGRQLIS